MKKKSKSNKRKKIQKQNQNGNFKLLVNPYIQQELLNYLEQSKSNEKNLEKIEFSPWVNFNIPWEFEMGVAMLGRALGVYPDMLCRYI